MSCSHHFCSLHHHDLFHLIGIEANDRLWTAFSLLLLSTDFLLFLDVSPHLFCPLQPPDLLWRPLWERTWTPCWLSTCWVGRSTVSRSSPPTRRDPARLFQAGPRAVSASSAPLISCCSFHLLLFVHSVHLTVKETAQIKSQTVEGWGWHRTFSSGPPSQWQLQLERSFEMQLQSFF